VPLVSFPRSTGIAPSARSGPFHVVNAARFTSVKNQIALVEAVALLKSAGRNVVMSLYGEGPELDACRARAIEKGVADRVEFPGFAPNWARRRADLFVLSSRHEGLCLVVLEAMQAGIPVATPVIGGLHDYASDETVRVLPDVEPATIARAIETAMEDREGLLERARNAASMVDARYSEAVVRRVYREVNELLKTRIAPDRTYQALPGADVGARVDAR
jgi:glycosyltransferase involved in cell wall biosynthesis